MAKLKKAELWFEQLFGFTEAQVLRGYTRNAYLEIQKKFAAKNGTLTSHTNGRKFKIGKFSTPTIAQLRKIAGSAKKGKMRVSHEIIGDALELHAKPENRGA